VRLFKIKSIKGKFVFAITLTCIMSLFLVSAIGYTISYHLVLTNSKNKLTETSQKYADEINYWLETQSSQLHSINEDLKMINPLNKTYLSNYLAAKYNTQNNIVLDYYIGFSDKSFITGSKRVLPTDYDCRTSDWYQQALVKQGIIYTAPYMAPDSKKIIITIAEPLSIKGKTVGVIAADIALYHLVQLVNNIKVAPNSYAFLLDSDKGFITHIKSQFLPTVDKKFYIDKVIDGRFKEVVRNIGMQDTSITEVKDFDAIHKYFVITHINASDWSLGLAIPKRELTKNLILLLALFIGTSLLTIAAMLFTIIFIINALFKHETHIVNSAIDATQKNIIELNNALEQVTDIISLMSKHSEETAAMSDATAMALESASNAALQINAFQTNSHKLSKFK